MIFADLIMPVPLPGVFTYRVPEEFEQEVLPGKRVIVQFGRKKIYSAIIRSLHGNPPEGYEIREIMSVLDSRPLVTDLQMRFWEWMADYYMCTTGEVLKAALPGGLKLESETGLAVRDPFSPKTETYLSLHPSVSTPVKLDEILEKLGRAPVQKELLERYLQMADFPIPGTPPTEIPKKIVLTGRQSVHAPLKALLDKNILLAVQRETSRIAVPEDEQKIISSLTLYQSAAIETIREQFMTKDVVLLHGITSGGKTEIYIHLVREALQKGKQVLYLLPEIALTAQIIVRLRNIFGRQAGVYHSGFSDAERVEIWNRVSGNHRDGYSLVLGARSALFLPFTDLGLVIVDEEHENTFKQFEPAPRYHARDSAIMLASMHGAKTLLGTATPSVESWHNALSGKYGLVNLTKRYRETQPPDIIIADTREARKRKKMRSLFTPQLLDAIEEALNHGEQVILFQNRRGYAPYIECIDCGWIPVCKHCDVSMTLHKGLNQLVCHYCSAAVRPPGSCPECGSDRLQTRGFGTEKIEDEVSIFFPRAKAGRLDLDSARRKRGHEKIIGNFEAGKIDILAGTQMIAKGLDFGKVSLVGILNADNLLFFPDFRAHERSFQLMSQVSGRAGRRVKRGKVIIQTGFPGHPVIKNIIDNNFERHFREQLAERRQFLYPPYVRLIKIVLKERKREPLEKAAASLATALRSVFGKRVLGPEYPLIGRVQNRYIMNILLKIERGANLARARELITAEIVKLQSQPGFRSCIIYPDVDPF